MAVNKQDIAYLSDVDDVATTPASAVQGNLPIFGADHALLDSGKKPEDFITQAGVDAAVQTATAEIWNAVNGVYAVASYTAAVWDSGVEYEVDDCCQYGGAGYRCIVEHTSGESFDTTKWKLVLTSDGKTAIAAMLASYSKDGLAALIDLAPMYSDTTIYSVGQMAVKDGVLQVCTKEGRGGAGAEFSRNATVEASIVTRLTALKVSDLTNDSNFTPSGAIDAAYDTTSKGYAVGDTCSHGARFYVCKQVVAQGAVWSDDDWTEKTFKSLISAQEQADWDEDDDTEPSYIKNKPTIPAQEQADWDEDDDTEPSYIKNKPTIPAAVVIDATLTKEGQAADAKAVGTALAGVLTTEGVPFKITELIPTTSTDPNIIVFQLVDRTMNVVSYAVAAGKTINLVPPSQPASSVSGTILARDFYVILNITSASDVSVAIQRASVQDAVGNVVTLTAPAGKVVSFRLTDSDRNSSVFLISGYADAAHGAISQIEKALDEILKDGGSGIPSLGFYLPDEDGKYHAITIVTDGETGEKNIGVEQEGVVK